MNEEQKSQLIAEAENVEAIRDFFVEWWSVEELYETLSKASITIMHIINKGDLCSDEKMELQELMQQHTVLEQVLVLDLGITGFYRLLVSYQDGAALCKLQHLI